MGMDRSRYPDNWEEISTEIRFVRAKGRCEWCGAPNGEKIQRLKSDPKVYRKSFGAEQLNDPEWYKPVKVILTVHHIGVTKPDGSPGDPHDKMDVRPENLAALCQRCHLFADLPIHIENAKKTRQRKAAAARAAAGQLELFTE